MLKLGCRVLFLIPYILDVVQDLALFGLPVWQVVDDHMVIGVAF